MARRYVRDRRGRFASVGATARGGRLTNLKGERYATETKAIAGGAPAGTVKAKPKSSKGAAERAYLEIRAGKGGKRLSDRKVMEEMQRRGFLKGGDVQGQMINIAANARKMAGTAHPAESTRANPILKGGSSAASNIRSLSRGATGAPRALRANAVRAFDPKSPRLRSGQLGRQISREMKDAPPSAKDKLNTAMGRVDAITARMDRIGARDIANRNSPDIGKRIISEVGRNAISNRKGVKVIQRRGQRAADAAARGSKPAQRATEIYDNQLAYMGKGKPKAAKSNLRPGPSNTQGPPKRRRKR